MFQWAARGNIWYLDLENVRSQVAVAMKDGNDDDLKSVGPIADSGFLLHHHPPCLSLSSIEMTDSNNWPNDDFTNPELQISLVKEIKTLEQHFPDDTIRTP